MPNTGIPFFNICILSFSNKKLHYDRGWLAIFIMHLVRGWYILCRKENTNRLYAPPPFIIYLFNRIEKVGVNSWPILFTNTNRRNEIEEKKNFFKKIKKKNYKNKASVKNIKIDFSMFMEKCIKIFYLNRKKIFF